MSPQYIRLVYLGLVAPAMEVPIHSFCNKSEKDQDRGPIPRAKSRVENKVWTMKSGATTGRMQYGTIIIARQAKILVLARARTGKRAHEPREERKRWKVGKHERKYVCFYIPLQMPIRVAAAADGSSSFNSGIGIWEMGEDELHYFLMIQTTTTSRMISSNQGHMKVAGACVSYHFRN